MFGPLLDVVAEPPNTTVSPQGSLKSLELFACLWCQMDKRIWLGADGGVICVYVYIYTTTEGFYHTSLSAVMSRCHNMERDVVAVRFDGSFGPKFYKFCQKICRPFQRRTTSCSFWPLMDLKAAALDLFLYQRPGRPQYQPLLRAGNTAPSLTDHKI